MKLAAMTFVFALFTTAAQASCSNIGCSGIGNEAVASVYVSGTGDILIETPPDQRANLNCTLASDIYMTLSRTHPAFKEAYAVLLMGLASGRKLYVRISEGSSDCRVSYVRMYN